MMQQVSKRLAGAAVAVVLAVGLLAGCSSGSGDPGSDAPAAPDTPATQETGDGGEASSAEAFIDAFESEGLECVPLDEDGFWGPGVVEPYNCSGDNSVKMTIRNFEDAAARDQQLEKVQELVCKSGLSRVASSDTWIVMPGGSRDVDFEVFGNAMESVGLDGTDYVCEEEA